MVAVAQLVELRIVVPAVVGSSPISHPTFAPFASSRSFGGASPLRRSILFFTPQSEGGSDEAL